MQSGQTKRAGWRQMMRWPAVALAGAAMGLSACAPAPAPAPKETPRWPTLALAPVPAFMKGTIYERVRITNTDPFAVGGYSIVVNLHNTGDGTASTAVREYIKKMMLVHDFESLENSKYANLTPEEILRDKRVAIVAVQGLLPVGARRGQQFDVAVSALRGSATKSLAHGELYQCELSERGLVNPTAIGARVLARIDGGEVFVNPAYALTDSGLDLEAERSSLRSGIILNGGIVTMDRPIFLQLREPQVSTARLIEGTIQHRWQINTVAAAEDEGVVQVYVPPQYNGDWRHFVGVMSHLYLSENPAFLVNKAKELIAAAHQPNAPLRDISYCWEGLGEEQLPIFSPLISDPDPDVAFAAARAAAFLGDIAAKHALLSMTQDPKNPNQLAAVQTLGALPGSPEVHHMLRALLDSESADVRIEAYKILSRDGEAVFTRKVGDRFFLDIVESSGKPMVYASRSGVPRIAIFGSHLSLTTPITFTVMDSRLMIASNSDTPLLSIFYRDPRQREPVNVLSRNDFPEIIARLGGEGPSEDSVFDFSYNDVVAIAQQLIDRKMVTGTGLRGETLAAAFVLEHPEVDASALTSLPKESIAGRPQGHGADAINSDSKNPEQRPASADATGDSTGNSTRPELRGQ